MSGLLLAVSIEFCGCDSVPDCARVRHTRIFSLPWVELLPQCSQCLTASEVTRLDHRRQTEQERTSGLGLPDNFASDRTVEQILRGEMEPSFDNTILPADDPSHPHLLGRSRIVEASARLAEPRPIPWSIPESVFFVYKGVSAGGETSQRTPAGTAFVVSVPAPRRGFVRFLVTARHVVDPRWANCAEPDPTSIEVRFNRRSGGVGYETIALQSDGRRRFLAPADTTADLAIIPLDQALGRRLEEYKFIDTPFRLLPSGRERLLLRPGLPVVTARLPQIPSDEPDTYPVFDAGTLATMPATSIDVQCGQPGDPPRDTLPPTKPLHVWFIDGGIPRGVSGSPVYTRLARAEGVAEATVLLGVQSVTWPDKGIVGITPSSVLADLIQSALQQHSLSMTLHHAPDSKQTGSLTSLY